MRSTRRSKTRVSPSPATLQSSRSEPKRLVVKRTRAKKGRGVDILFPPATRPSGREPDLQRPLPPLLARSASECIRALDPPLTSSKRKRVHPSRPHQLDSHRAHSQAHRRPALPCPAI